MNTKTLSRDVLRKKITDEIHLGTDIWTNNADETLPYNPRNGERYRSTNALFLRNTRYKDPRWLTYDDIKEFDASIKLGEKGTVIQRWTFEEKRTKLDGEQKPVLDRAGIPVTEVVKLDKPRLSTVLVFNAEQVEGLEAGDTRNRPEDAQQHLYRYYDMNRESASMASLERGEEQDSDSFSGEIISRIVKERWENSPNDVVGTLSHARTIMLQQMTVKLLCDDYGVKTPSNKVSSSVRDKWVALIEREPFALFQLSTEAEKKAERYNDLIRSEEIEVEAVGQIVPPALKDGGDIGRNRLQDQAMDERIGEAVNVAPAPGSSRSVNKDLSKESNGIEVMQGDMGNGDEEEKHEEVRQVPAESSESEKVEMDEGRNNAEKKPANTVAKTSKETFGKRTYLYVPYEKRHDARKYGAVWDKERKSWYAPKGTYKSGLAKWETTDVPDVKKQKTLTEIISDFAAALEQAGLVVPAGGPVMDGSKHRVPVVGGKRSARDGEYVGYLDGIPAGFIKNYKSGYETNWKVSGLELNKDEIKKLNVQAAQRAHERDEEMKARFDEVSKKAEYIFNSSSPDATSSPYIISKCIIAVGVRKSRDGNVLVPVRDIKGKIWSVQFICNEKKTFLKNGKVDGNFHVLDSNNSLKKQETLIFAESYSTAASIHQATGKAVVCSFNAGNLTKVAKAFKEEHPEKGILIAGDNDWHLPLQNPPYPNAGAEKAKMAAEGVGGTFILPIFNDQTPDRKRTDFNDVHRVHGLKAVKSQIEKGLMLEAKKKERITEVSKERHHEQKVARTIQENERVFQPTGQTVNESSMEL